MKPIKILSLFSGYGSQELALKYAGIPYEAIASSDILEPANKVYDKLHTTTYGNLGDVTKIKEDELPECDFLTYSFPCQDISIAGKQRGITKGTRSGLLYEVERLVGVNRPKYLLMENVKNLIGHNHIEQFHSWIARLEEFGYTNVWAVLNGADFGCPQNRERVFMFSELNGDQNSLNEKMNRIKSTKMSRVPMSEFIEEGVDHSSYLDVPYELSEPKKQMSVCKLVARRTDIKYDQAKRIYSVEACSPCLTTTGSPQIMTKDGKVRTLTAREAYRFMGVKDDDIDKMLTADITTTKHIALAGNSICVPVMQAMFTEFFS